MLQVQGRPDVSSLTSIHPTGSFPSHIAYDYIGFDDENGALTFGKCAKLWADKHKLDNLSA
jgi:hypothetical protein